MQKKERLKEESFKICQNIDFLCSEYVWPELALSQFNIRKELQNHIFMLGGDTRKSSCHSQKPKGSE